MKISVLVIDVVFVLYGIDIEKVFDFFDLKDFVMFV